MKEILNDWLVLSLLAAVSIGFLNLTIQSLGKEIDKTHFRLEELLPLILLLLAILALAYLGFYHKTITQKMLILIIAAGIFSIITGLLALRALTTGKAVNAAAMFNLNVIVILLVTVLFFGEKISVKELAGILLATIGVVLIAI
ncbi:MAG: EamA family transporter [Candidatus Micrarchaeota archaeon]